MSPPATRPVNVLLVMADQMRADCLQAVNPRIKTPNIQRLVDRGILFTRAYAPTPVCLPCRTSVLTGQYPSTHGAMHNECTLPRDHPSTIAAEFTRAGYYTHVIGKSHFNSMHDPASPEGTPHVFNHEFFRGWHGPWYGYTHADISVGHSTERVAASMHYGAWLADRGVDIERYFGTTGYADHGPWDLPEEHHASTWVADTAIAAIDRSLAAGQPFFLSVNFPDPHNPCMVPEPWASMYDPDAIPVHGFVEGEREAFASKPPFYAEIVSPGGWHPSDPDLPGSCNVSSLRWTPREVQENAAAYYGMVSLLDKHLGRVLDKIEAEGLLDSTLVIFTADHGDFLGDHGMWWKSLVGFEEAMHVPLVASWPGHLPRGATSDALHSLVDLPATILSLAGLPVPRSYEGIDQRAGWEDPARAIRNHVVVEERPYDTPFTLRVIITPAHKLCFYAHRPYGELYDMQADPRQLRNLWDDPACQPLKLELIGKLLSHEVTKRSPEPNATPRFLASLPPGVDSRHGFFMHHGKLVAGAGDVLAMLVPASRFGTSLIEVPLAEILEDVTGARVSIETGTVPVGRTGTLEVSKDGRLSLVAAGRVVVTLAELLGGTAGNDVVIAGWPVPAVDGVRSFAIRVVTVG